MTSKAKTKTTIKTVKELETAEAVAIQNQTDADFKNALLIVSLAVNIIVLIAWLALKVTSQFDYQIATVLFYR